MQKKPTDRLDLAYKLVIIGAIIQLAAIAAFAFYLWKIHPNHSPKPSSDRVHIELVHDTIDDY